MKKILLGTSAVALSSMVATSANAAKWELNWGGFFEAYVGFVTVDGDGDFDGVDVRQDSEIIFKPKITLDNGLQFGADIQLEGNTGGDQIDESFIFVKGSFGEVLIGSENSAGYKMTFAAPDVTALGVNSGSISAYINVGSNQFRAPGRSSFVEVDGNLVNDSQRITYFTPRFAGFQLGASYARDAEQDTFAPVDLDSNLGNIFDFGVNYVNSFGGVDVAVSGRYGIGESNDAVTPAVAAVPGVFQDAAGNLVAAAAAPAGSTQIVAPVAADPGGAQIVDGDPEVYAIGINLGFAGFTVGGSFAQEDGGLVANDGEFFDVGVSYATGPWAASVTYANSDIDATGELDQFIAGVTYKLGPGVKAGLTAAYIEQDSARAAAGGSNHEEAFIIETGFTLNF